MNEHPPVEVVWLGRVAYADALARQEDLVQSLREKRAPETLLLLEHESVYTIGRTRDRSSLRDPATLPHPVVEINRGGQATYHGPGQLVGYPILDLGRRGRDLHEYLRFLEDCLVATLATFGIEAQPRTGLTGVWVGDRKIASIGVGVRHWISMHGFALNVARQAEAAFAEIVPCGIPGVRVTSIESELGRACPGVKEVAAIAGRILVDSLGGL